MEGSKLIVLDRDGVINQDSDAFIKSPDEWIAIPGSLEAIARLCREDYQVVLATNQSGIARGLFSINALNRIHEKMLGEVRRAGGEISAIFFCPHVDEDNCECRKPRPGMLLELSRRTNRSLADIPVVGDSKRDLEAANAVNATPILVKTGKGQQTADALNANYNPNDPLAQVSQFPSLYDYVDHLLAGGEPAA